MEKMKKFGKIRKMHERKNMKKKRKDKNDIRIKKIAEKSLRRKIR